MLAAFAALSAGAAFADDMVIGNSAGSSVAFETVGSSEVAGSALFYPASTMQAFNGCSITKVEIGFQNTTEENAVTVFVSKSLDGEPIYKENFTASASGRNTFTLSSPVKLDGDGVYIGYTVKGVRTLAYSNALVEDEEWVLYKGKPWQKYDLSKGLCATMFVTVEGASLPANNVRLTALSMPDYSVTNQPVSFEGKIANLGAEEVKSLTVTYFADGKSVGTETIDGLSVKPRRAAPFSLLGLKLDAEGEPELQVEIAKVNGEADPVPADNLSRKNGMIVRDEFVSRNTLLEVFSTELCSQCPQAHRDIETALGDKTNVVEIGHHAGFYTDALTIGASQTYEWFYSDVNMYAPAVMFDRTGLVDDYPDVFKDGTPIVAPTAKVLEALYDIIGKAPAFVSIGIDRTFDEASRSLSFTVAGQQLLPLTTPESLRLFVFLTEDSIATETQRGASGTFYHRHSARRILTPDWGDNLELGSDGFSHVYATDIPAEWNLKNVRIVAFVANVNSEDKNDCRVMNACEATLADGLSSGINGIDDDTVGKPAELMVFTAEGTLVSVLQGDADVRDSGLPHGVYIIKAVGNGIARSYKVAVE